MSSKVRSLEKALSDRKKANGAVKESETPAVTQFTVEGEAPFRMPRHGETVEFTWSEPMMVGAPQLHLGFIVSLANPQSKDGRVNGWVVMDPTMQTSDNLGRPIQVPPLIPVANAAYSKERKAMTWRFHADVTEV